MRCGDILVLIPPIAGALLAPLLWFVTSISTPIAAGAVLYAAVLAICAVIYTCKKQFRSAALYFCPLIFFLSFRLSGAPYLFVRQVGFRLSTIPESQYIQRCHSTSFSEHGHQEAVGLCKIIDRKWSEGWDYIVYDTSGQVLNPVISRTSRWRTAVNSLPNGRVIDNVSSKATPLWRSFYAIHVALKDADPSAARNLQQQPKKSGD